MYRKWNRRYHRGFTLIEVLFSLSISLIILLNCSLLIKNVLPVDKEYYIDNSLQNGMATLSYELYTSHQLSYGNELVYHNEENERFCIKLDGQRLVITPGYNILCDDITSVYFYNNNGLIYLDCTFLNEDYTFFIGSDYETQKER
ncbi:MAG: type II secretion system protein [Faecalibacillus sp.]